MKMIVRAYLELFSLEYFLLRKDFASIYDKVRNIPVCPRPHPSTSTEKVCDAVIRRPLSISSNPCACNAPRRRQASSG